MQAAVRLARSPSPRLKFQHLLRHWRSARRLSQLDLAAEAGISARHLCFLETGRSRPSRDMVGLLAEVLDVPLADRNALLIAAGFAPRFSALDLDAPALAPVRQALDFMLAQQEPYPALVLDDGWTITMRNKAAAHVFGAFRARYEMPPALAANAMHVLCHPGGLRRFMSNWEDFVGGYIQVLHREAMQGLNQATASLLQELLRYPGMPRSFAALDVGAADAPMRTMRLRFGRTELAFFVTLTTFAMPRDVTLQQIKVEGFFPADAATAAAARRLARGGRLPRM